MASMITRILKGRHEGRNFAGVSKSRAELRTQNLQGVIPAGEQSQQAKKYRRDCLELFDKYYEGRQYDDLPPWDIEPGAAYIPVRKRRPRLQFAFAKVLGSRVSGKLVGRNAFPRLVSEGGDKEWEEFIRFVLRVSNLQAMLAEPFRRLTVAGSVFVRFFLSGGSMRVEHYHSKHCYPLFDDAGELVKLTVQYVYEDPQDIDEKGCPRQKWFKMELGQEVDVLYDNPPYKQGEEPLFQVVSEAAHELGFVQGEWFRLSHNRHNDDGDSLIQDILGFIDELNYSLSQSSQAVQYNQDPQLAVKGMTEDEIQNLVRSAMQGWNLGRDGEANFLETSLSGVERADLLRDKVKLHLQDVTRIIMMDPEKMVAQAQSGVALEVLHGPFVELIDEIRPMIQGPLVKLVQKMAFAILKVAQAGGPVPINVPRGWLPQSIDLTPKWQPVFPQTIEDIQKKANLGIQLANATVVSREFVLRWLAADLGIEDIELELDRIAKQPVINPFGTF